MPRNLQGFHLLPATLWLRLICQPLLWTRGFNGIPYDLPITDCHKVTPWV